MRPKLTYKKATLEDAKAIHSIANKFAKREEMLPRSLNDIYEHIRDYFVCKQDQDIIAISALHILWDNLAEIRSIAVSRDYQRQGIGSRLVKQCLKDARSLGVKRVFALTYVPDFFRKLGFSDIDKNELPQKIWGDCLKCPQFPDCNEEAVILRLTD